MPIISLYSSVTIDSEEKFILMICTRLSSRNWVELFGTVDHQSLDRLEVVLLVLMVLLTITLLLISLRSILPKFAQIILRQELTV